ncbi:MAG: bifunctional tRNA (5-methylaminomethyl-2-thiouridine)(34)-methyltransferase MnmD/FAD-dependent 5-carboxymethylaminomethyl-2-thiouridine(34) oxidoreductase MnmC [Burkholderiales bacterium]|nr:bifunctional tRNA (5-methylaminomethyl-2-thiouridine)(34)-methyltransferase MnmD/FAD-dependent 5-carboxymethylaminomethyl-2-thiouridine(34) oxidoreductase MnmC [Burkholderiales bacterium]
MTATWAARRSIGTTRRRIRAASATCTSRAARGLGETRHVFLAGNGLAERWARLALGARFAIGETGFGTGLNFCAAWALWATAAPRDAILHYVSVEAYPLARTDLARALGAWPELAAQSGALLAQYGALASGWHRFGFADARVLLTLGVGGAAERLGELAGRCDAWFLDGFAPARNPDMWSEAVLEAVAAHSFAGATFATYTAAGAVRRGLEAAGFSAEKRAGFGHKREMLAGALARPAPARAQRTGGRSAVVIGGGLAGAASAWSLAQRGWQVTLLERHAALAEEASGNPQGVLYARLAARPSALGELVLSGYQHSIRVLNAILPQGEETWRACGVLQLALDAKTAARQDAVIATGLPAAVARRVDRAEASALAGVPLPAGGLFFPGAGWVHPPALVRALAAHPRIEVRTGVEARALERAPDGEWRVLADRAVAARAPVVVLAAAVEVARFAQTRALPLHAVRGQLTLVPATEASRALATIVCGEASITPARGGAHTLGATFVHEFHDLAVRAAEHRSNLADLGAMAPALAQALCADALDPETLAGRAAVRCTSPDRLCVVGPVPGEGGLHVNTAHGSRGLIGPPLCAEVLAARLEEEPAPLSARLVAALDPGRFRHGA